MRVELHMLQNFAPSCLNRDDVNAPKDCEFGGVRRARISSQCLKRTVRVHWTQFGVLPANRAIRTRRLVEKVSHQLEAAGQDLEQARVLAQFTLERAGLGVTKDGTTEYLLFLSERAVAGLAGAIREHWDALVEAQQKAGTPAKGRKDGITLPDDVTRALEEVFSGQKAADLALFGRMIADVPGLNVDAACQVAHAISTHRVNTDLDFYTALDDLQPREEAGAGMMGTIEFNSACFYRYAMVDLRQLSANLEGDSDLAAEVLEAFIRAAVEAIPSGKQNSMAAHNPPSFVLAVVRRQGSPWSLANAFQHPVGFTPGEQGGLVERSILRLDDYWGKLNRVYGDKGIEACVALSVEDAPLANITGRVSRLDDLVNEVITRVKEHRQWASC